MTTTFADMLETRLREMRECCAIRDARYWDLASVLTDDVVREPETLSEAGRNHVLCLVLRDGYEIRLLFGQRMGMPTHFNGYVTIPSSAPFARSVLTSSDYDGLQIAANIQTVELTYSHNNSKVGWDHLHSWDGDLGEPEAMQPHTQISGPVQVFEEAMAVVNDLRRYEWGQQKKAKAVQVAVLLEELMAKAWHPTRVKMWVEAGVDM